MNSSNPETVYQYQIILFYWPNQNGL